MQIVGFLVRQLNCEMHNNMRRICIMFIIIKISELIRIVESHCRNSVFTMDIRIFILFAFISGKRAMSILDGQCSLCISDHNEKNCCLGVRPGLTDMFSQKRRLESTYYGFKERRGCTFRGAKSKALIHCAVTVQLVRVFAFPYAKNCEQCIFKWTVSSCENMVLGYLCYSSFSIVMRLHYLFESLSFFLSFHVYVTM